jgi:hypothetical protein
LTTSISMQLDANYSPVTSVANVCQRGGTDKPKGREADGDKSSDIHRLVRARIPPCSIGPRGWLTRPPCEKRSMRASSRSSTRSETVTFFAMLRVTRDEAITSPINGPQSNLPKVYCHVAFSLLPANLGICSQVWEKPARLARMVVLAQPRQTQRRPVRGADSRRVLRPENFAEAAMDRHRESPDRGVVVIYGDLLRSHERCGWGWKERQHWLSPIAIQDSHLHAVRRQCLLAAPLVLRN